MKILVTGGAGFIGSNIAKQLVQDGHEVIVIDNFLLGSPDNLKDIADKITFVQGDIRNCATMNEITKGVDVVFNEAAASSSPMFMTNLRDAVSVNVDGFINVLNACKLNDVKALVYASSSSIYGNGESPLNENDKTVVPNFYAVTKHFNEELANVYASEYGLPCIGLRYMSVYGPNEKAKGVYANLVSQFLWDMMKNERPVIYGDGTQTRDFIYAKDVVNANLLAMEYAMSQKKADIFNVGTSVATSLNSLIATINRVLGKSIEATHVENKIRNYIAVQKADTHKAEDLLDFTAQYTVQQGIEELVKENA
ncbi:MAG: SDR family NAD(P)-dependent oxidoreductase [Candidatus Aenigmatarchaeota archaeon]